MSALTKILIVLQLVFSLVMSVLLVLEVSKQHNYKDDADGANAARVALTATVTASQAKEQDANARASDAQQKVVSLSNQLSQAKADAINAQAKADAAALDLQSQIASLRVQVQTLTATSSTSTQSIAAKDAELDKLRPQVSDLITKYNEVYRAKNEADNQLSAAEQAIRKLQEQLQQASTTTPAGGATASLGTGQVQVLSNAASASGAINAKVGQVAESNGRTLIELPLGSRDGIQVNTKLFIYRGNSFIADAVVQRVTPDQSVAAIRNPKPGQSVQEGDMVSTVGQ